MFVIYQGRSHIPQGSHVCQESNAPLDSRDDPSIIKYLKNVTYPKRVIYLPLINCVPQVSLEANQSYVHQESLYVKTNDTSKDSLKIRKTCSCREPRKSLNFLNRSTFLCDK